MSLRNWLRMSSAIARVLRRERNQKPRTGGVLAADRARLDA